MVEPISTGALVVGVLSMGAAAFAKGALGQAGKDAYESLRGAVVRFASHDTEQLEKNPDSENRKAVLADDIDEQSKEEQARLAELAAMAAKVFREEAEAGRPIGVEIGQLKAVEVQLGTITTGQGTSFKVDTVETGKFSIDRITTGKDASGKR